MARRSGAAGRISIGAILQQYGERAAQAARESLLENGETVAEEAKRRCPVDTGRLRDSVHVEPKGANKVRIVAPHGTPFMRPALEAKREELKQHTIEKIRAAVAQH